ncbi:MAG: hypothetical protein FWB76_07770 [Oscillospiraceae bacterium]|nr:hypothetical protein [Oscillospiraceae bacterium]
MFKKIIFVLVGAALGSLLGALSFILIPMPVVAAILFFVGLIGGGFCGAKLCK